MADLDVAETAKNVQEPTEASDDLESVIKKEPEHSQEVPGKEEGKQTQFQQYDKARWSVDPKLEVYHL